MVDTIDFNAALVLQANRVNICFSVIPMNRRDPKLQAILLWFLLLGILHFSITKVALAKQNKNLNPVQLEVLRGHGGDVNSIVFHPAGGVLFSGGSDAQVIGWDIANAAIPKKNCFEIDRRKAGERISSLSFDRAGNVFAMSGVTHWGNGFGSALRIYTPFQKEPFSIGAQAKWSYTSCDVAPDGSFAIAGARNNLLRAVALVRKIKKKGVKSELARIDAPGIPGAVFRVCCHPRQHVVAAGGEGGWISLYDVEGKVMMKRQRPTILRQENGDDIHGLKFSTDGKQLIAASTKNEISIYDVKTGAIVRRFSPRESVPLWLDVHPKEPWIIIGYENGVARIINYEDEKIIGVLTGHRGPVKAAAFSPNGRWAATGSADQSVRIWNLFGKEK